MNRPCLNTVTTAATLFHGNNPQSNLTNILKESDLSAQDIEIAAAALPDILQDMPKTESASLKFKRIMGKLSKPFYDICIKVVTDIASETAKKTIGL